MATNKPTFGEGIWAESPVDSDTPTSGKVATGWTVETPPFEWQNWWQNRVDNMLFHINEHGMPLWDNQTDYPVNALVMRSGAMYRSLQTPNIAQDPTAVSSTYWVETSGAEAAAGNLKVANNLSDVNNVVTAFNNIKQTATTSSRGVMLQATDLDVRLGTASEFADCEQLDTYYQRRSSNFPSGYDEMSARGRFYDLANNDSLNVSSMAFGSTSTVGPSSSGRTFEFSYLNRFTSANLNGFYVRIFLYGSFAPGTFDQKFKMAPIGANISGDDFYTVAMLQGSNDSGSNRVYSTYVDSYVPITSTDRSFQIRISGTGSTSRLITFKIIGYDYVSNN